MWKNTKSARDSGINKHTKKQFILDHGNTSISWYQCDCPHIGQRWNQFGWMSYSHCLAISRPTQGFREGWITLHVWLGSRTGESYVFNLVIPGYFQLIFVVWIGQPSKAVLLTQCLLKVFRVGCYYVTDNKLEVTKCCFLFKYWLIYAKISKQEKSLLWDYLTWFT